MSPRAGITFPFLYSKHLDICNTYVSKLRDSSDVAVVISFWIFNISDVAEIILEKHKKMEDPHVFQGHFLGR